MTPQALKTSILQLAIQGKLVEQRPEEGTGEELYRQIKAEKRALVNAGKIKKDKALAAISEDDIAFEVPAGWMLTRIGAICQLLDGEKKEGDKLPCLDARYMRGATTPTTLTKGRFVEAGSRLMLVDGENSGEVFTASTNGYMGSTFKKLYIPQAVCADYILFFFQYHKKTLRNNKKGAAIPHLNKEIFFNLVLPLPPLAEQKRIVAKVKELQPYIDRYEAAWRKLEDFNRRFPSDIRKAILQMAVQGKLADQRPEEGSGRALYRQIQGDKKRLIEARIIKKDKPLPRITEDEMPFDIPESWMWVRIGSILHKLVDGTHKTPKYTSSGIPFVSVRNMSNGKLSLENTRFISEREHQELWKRCNPERNDILLSKIGTTGVPAKVDTDTEFSLFVSVALLKFNRQLLDIDFLIYSIMAPDFQRQCREHTRGVGNKNWVIQDIANTVMPLPPLAEQKRIVAKLEEILPLCDKLK